MVIQTSKGWRFHNRGGRAVLSIRRIKVDGEKGSGAGTILESSMVAEEVVLSRRSALELAKLLLSTVR